MSNILLTDPVLHWLKPSELIHFTLLSKKHKETIQEFIQHQRHYVVYEEYTLPKYSAHELYARFPSVEKLTVHLSYLNRVADYLRPSLRSLTIVFPLFFYQDRDTFHYSLGNLSGFTDACKEIQSFLESTPESQLKELTLSFSSNVSVMFVYRNRYRIGYDRFGPLYEDMETTKVIEDVPAWQFLSLIDEADWNLLMLHVNSLVSLANWNRITLPYQLKPSQDSLKITYTDVYEIDDFLHEDLEEYLYQVRESKI